MSYRIELHREAEKTLDRLDRTTARRIEAKIEALAQVPFDPRLSRQMETNPEARYSRVGNWRIIYRVKEEAGVLDITAIRPRGRAYRE